MQRGRLWRHRIIGMIGVIALAGDIDPAVSGLVLVGDVVNRGTFRHGEARIVLRENLAERLHRLQESERAELAAHREDCMIDKGLVQRRARRRVELLAEVDPRFPHRCAKRAA